MALSLRRTNFRSPADAHRQDYLVMEDRQVIGRIYEGRYVPADVRWFWSVTEHVDPAHGHRDAWQSAKPSGKLSKSSNGLE
jgi:hypothetical protein